MNVISHRTLVEFYTKHPETKDSLERWHGIVSRAKWKNFADIRRDFPSADYVGNDRYVFNIKENHFRLVVLIVFVQNNAFIRFVGTHKEYDKINCSKI